MAAKTVKASSEPKTKPAKAEETKEPKKVTAKKIDVHQYITVRSGYYGKLVYKSPKTGERFVWNEFGAEQEMELQELRNARNVYKKYFTNNWFIFEDDWVIDYLGVRQLYKFALPIEGYDHVFLLDDDELKTFIHNMSDGQKKNFAYRANELIRNGEIDSRKKIAVLEEALGLELVEH